MDTLDPVAAPAAESIQAAAIVHDGSLDVDALLTRITRQQRALGRRVHGLLMQPRQGDSACSAAMVLVDIERGDEYLVSQAMGSASKSCRADPQGFARASEALRRAIDAVPDLVVCNRFGTLEAEGGGFAEELLALMAQGVPLLTVVATRNIDAWLRFTGGAALLPAEPAAIEGWLARTLTPIPDAEPVRS